jgi:carbohydrate kinase (thermoresistant glucokinase family)
VATSPEGRWRCDRSRSPWLAGIARRIAVTDPDDGLVITCSALKRIYREVLRAANPHALFGRLTIEPDDATARVASRDSHFMPASLVTSSSTHSNRWNPTRPA